MSETKRLRISDFTGGYNLALDSTKIKENEFTKFENLIVYKLGNLGNAVKRKGFISYDTEESGYTIIKLYEYITNSKTSNVQKIVAKTASTLEIRDLSGAFSAIIANGTEDATKKCKFLTFRDNLYIADRQSTVQLTNKVYDSTSVLDMGTPPCGQTFWGAEAGSGSLSAGWRYLITFLYDGNQESYFIPRNDASSEEVEKQSNLGNSGSYLDYAAFLLGYVSVSPTSALGVNLYNIPTGNSRVTARKIYRTKNAGSAFYYIGTIDDNTSTTYYDDKQDAELVELADMSMLLKPYKSKTITAHKNRVFMGNCDENQFADFPAITNITLTASAGAGTLTNLAPYSYKFAYLYPEIQTNWTGSDVGTPYTGFVGALSGAKSVTLSGAGEDTVAIAVIPNTNAYSRKVAIFRNVSMTASSYTITSGVVTLTVTTGHGVYFKIGETVTVASTPAVPGIDGARIVTATAANTITFTTTAIDIGATAVTTTVAGGNYYFLGNTAIDGTTFTDRVPNDSLVYPTAYGFYKHDFTFTTVDKKYPSLLAWSDVDKGDIFRGLSQSQVFENDNDEIKAIADASDGVLIWKNRSICKLYTNSDEAFWQVRKVYENIGCSDTVDLQTFVKLPNDEYFWMYNNEFYHWREGTMPGKCSEKIQTILDGLTITNLDVSYDWKRNWVVISYGTSAISGDLFIYDLNFRDEKGWGTFYRFISCTVPDEAALKLRCPFTLRDGTLIFGYQERKRIFKYHTNEYDTLYNTGTAGYKTTPISAMLSTKILDDYYINAKKIMVKAKTTATSTDSLTVYAYKDGSGTAYLSSNTAMSDSTLLLRLNVPTGAELASGQNCKQFQAGVGTNTDDTGLAIQEIIIEYSDAHERGGF